MRCLFRSRGWEFSLFVLLVYCGPVLFGPSVKCTRSDASGETCGVRKCDSLRTFAEQQQVLELTRLAGLNIRDDIFVIVSLAFPGLYYHSPSNSRSDLLL